MSFLGVALALLVVGGAVSGCGSTASDPPIDCTDGCWEPTPEDQALAAELCTHVEACCIANDARETADVESCMLPLHLVEASEDELAPAI
ncbi:MAG TPA: hypothetical protein VKY73_02845 [Polyangiaceae bacterium]|nr:hypothetical protein [Polyangiaceae bacterium]